MKIPDFLKKIMTSPTYTHNESVNEPAAKTSLPESMEFELYIKEIVFNDNSTVEIEKDDIIIIVGANNVGKSATLIELNNYIFNHEYPGRIANQVILEGNINQHNLKEYVKSVSRLTHTGYSLSYQGLGFEISENSVDMAVQRFDSGFTEARNSISNILTTEDRLKITNPPKNIKVTTDPATHPIHYLQIDEKLEAKFSSYFHQAFGADLIVHRNAGGEVPLYVGTKPVLADGEDRASINYIINLENQDLLHKQGDGMRSFVGVLLTAFVSHHKILFIDEPEAFLHPPQARLLGKMLVRDSPRKRQLILTTHSGDFLRGALDAGSSNLKVVRLQRNGVLNTASILNNQDIKAIWDNSILRHSNILDGLFHSQVVICESDSDNRFYSATLSSAFEVAGKQTPDVLFTQCGGKHRIPTVVKALKKLDVPVKVISDFDVLNDTNPLRLIYEELGGNWSLVEKDWRLVKTAIEQKRPELETLDVKEKINSILEGISERIFPKNKKTEIESVLRKTSAWADAKEQGKHYIPSGEASQAFSRIQTLFKEKGLFIVEVGELEGFVKSVGNHGPKWINEVMLKNLGTDEELNEARQFVEEVVLATIS